MFPMKIISSFVILLLIQPGLCFRPFYAASANSDNKPVIPPGEPWPDSPEGYLGFSQTTSEPQSVRQPASGAQPIRQPAFGSQPIRQPAFGPQPIRQPAFGPPPIRQTTFRPPLFVATTSRRPASPDSIDISDDFPELLAEDIYWNPYEE